MTRKGGEGRKGKMEGGRNGRRKERVEAEIKEDRGGRGRKEEGGRKKSKGRDGKGRYKEEGKEGEEIKCKKMRWERKERGRKGARKVNKGINKKGYER